MAKPSTILEMADNHMGDHADACDAICTFTEGDLELRVAMPVPKTAVSAESCQPPSQSRGLRTISPRDNRSCGNNGKTLVHGLPSGNLRDQKAHGPNALEGSFERADLREDSNTQARMLMNGWPRKRGRSAVTVLCYSVNSV
jgi:hypothetical protein